ncbi:MAG: BatD family protein [Nitrospinota bacterium]|nr:BatD family protein [Nitrospinota bacterium]
MIKTGKSRSLRSRQAFAYTTGVFLWLPAFLILAMGTAWPADIQVTASVDKQELTLEDSVNFSIVVEGTQSAPPPELPLLDSFKVRNRGSSSSFQIINGDRSSSTTYNFTLLPKETGTFTIGPATVNIGGKKHRTAPITLVVKEATAVSDTSREIFAEMVVSNKKPYVQEQITATLRIYRRVEIRNLKTDIEFPGFREEALEGPVQNTRIINGLRYLSYEIPTALFPLRPGKVDIPASLVEFDQVDRSRGGRPSDPFDPFGQGSIFNNFGRLQHKILRTKSITLDIQSLPRKNRPENFSNLVGDFTISAQLSRTEVEVGDTTTLTVTVAGQGNVNDLSLPSPQWGDNFKVYQDQSEYRPTTGARTVSGEKIYTYALVPLKTGRLQVPAIPLNYFNPTKGDYVSIQTQALPLSVSPGKGDSKLKIVESGSDTTGNRGDPIQKIGEDILPIHTGPEVFESQNFATGSGMLYGIGLLLPAVLFLVYSGIYKRQHRLKYDIAFSRSHGAYKQALKKLHALSPNSDPREIARELSLIVREYLGNILNLQGTAITSTEVEEKLMKGNFSVEEIQATQKLLEKYETLQYAPTTGNPPEELIQDAGNLLDQLEKQS